MSSKENENLCLSTGGTKLNGIYIIWYFKRRIRNWNREFERRTINLMVQSEWAKIRDIDRWKRTSNEYWNNYYILILFINMNDVEITNKGDEEILSLIRSYQ